VQIPLQPVQREILTRADSGGDIAVAPNPVGRYMMLTADMLYRFKNILVDLLAHVLCLVISGYTYSQRRAVVFVGMRPEHTGGTPVLQIGVPITYLHEIMIAYAVEAALNMPCIDLSQSGVLTAGTVMHYNGIPTIGKMQNYSFPAIRKEYEQAGRSDCNQH